jgi:hypothetical protein
VTNAKRTSLAGTERGKVADELSDEEQALLAKHRKAKAASSRKVKVKGRHEDSGAEYEFDLDGDEAERVIARHRSLFEEQPEGDADDGKKPARKGPYFKGKSE